MRPCVFWTKGTILRANESSSIMVLGFLLVSELDLLSAELSCKLNSERAKEDTNEILIRTYPPVLEAKMPETKIKFLEEKKQ